MTLLAEKSTPEVGTSSILRNRPSDRAAIRPVAPGAKLCPPAYRAAANWQRFSTKRDKSLGLGTPFSTGTLSPSRDTRFSPGSEASGTSESRNLTFGWVIYRSPVRLRVLRITASVKLRDRQVSPAPLLRSFGTLAVKLADHGVCGTHEFGHLSEISPRMQSNYQICDLQVCPICKFAQIPWSANLPIGRPSPIRGDSPIGRPQGSTTTATHGAKHAKASTQEQHVFHPHTLSVGACATSGCGDTA